MKRGQTTWRPITTVLVVVLCLVAIALASMLVPHSPRPAAGKTNQTEAASGQIILHIRAKQIAVTSAPVELGSGPVNIPLALVGEQPKIGDLLRSLGPQQRIYLSLRSLSVQEQPGVVYLLYLDLPGGPGAGKDDPHYVGTLNFFNAAKINEPPAQPNKNDFFRSYDVTGLLMNLQKTNILSDPTTLTITPSREPLANAKPTIGRIEMLVQTD